MNRQPDARPIGTAVVGLGAFGRRHAALYGVLDGSRLVGVHDSDGSVCAGVARELGVRAFTTLDDLLACGEVEAVSICTPDDAHVDVTLAVLAADKHVLVEKPLATTREGLAQLVAAAEARVSHVSMVGHVLHFDPRYYYAHEAVAHNEIGHVVHMYARRHNTRETAERLKGRTSISLFLMVHDLEVMSWISGDQVRAVSAIGATTGARRWGRNDSVGALLEYESGAIGIVEGSWALPADYVAPLDAELEIVGTEGRLDVKIHEQGLRLFAERLVYPNPGAVTVHGLPRGPLADELTIFLRCVRDGHPPPVGFRDGAKAALVALSIDSAIVLGRRVAVDYACIGEVENSSQQLGKRSAQS